MTTPNAPGGEAARLTARIAALTEANQTLRDLPDPSASPPELEARTILLRREARRLEDVVATLVPYDGPPPATLAEYEALPEAHRRQVAREQGDHVLALRQVEQLLATAENDPEAPNSFL
ncbi:MAG: hypothetical protein ACOC7R_00265 [Planctomycetota bacterium]